MKKYNWFQKIAKSLVPGDFYLDILHEKMSHAFGYIILFILAMSLIAGTYTGLQMRSSLNATLADYQSGIIPRMSIINNEMTLEGDEPVTITHFEPVLIIDDSFQMDTKELLSYENVILVQKTGISIFSNVVGSIVYDYETLIPMDLTSDDIVTILSVSAAMMIPSAIFTQFLASTIGFFFNSLFILLMGNIFRTVTGLKLTLGQIYHLVIYAMTFSVFWTHFTFILTGTVPIWLDNFVFYAIPSMIIISVFRMIRNKALGEMDK